MRVACWLSLWVLLLLLIPEVFYGQQYPYHHYSLEDGLPSTETYSAFQDSKGYMWFSTDAGVSRFNGYEFENFNASDGLTDNTVFLITEDHKGRIWFATFNRQLCYYYKGVIKPYKNNPQIAKTIITSQPVESFAVDSLDNVYMGFFNEGIFKISKDGNIHQLIEMPDQKAFVNELIYIGKQQVFGSKPTEAFAKRYSQGVGFNYYETIKVDGETISHREKEFTNKSIKINTAITSSDHSVWWYNDQTFTLFSRNQTMDLPIDLSENKYLYNTQYFHPSYWYTANGSGAHKVTIKDNGTIVKRQYLPGKSISRVYIDNEKGTWFMTLSDGIYYLPYKEMELAYLRDKKVKQLDVDSFTRNLYAMTYEGIVYQITSDTIVTKLDLPQNSEFLTIGKEKNSLILAKGDNMIDVGLVMSDSLILAYQIGAVKDFLIENDTTYIVNHVGLTIKFDDKVLYNSYASANKHRIWCSSVIKMNKKVWLGTNNGLLLYEKGQITRPFSNNNYLNTAITSLKKLNQHSFVVGTKSHGLIWVRDSQLMAVIDKNKGLASNLIKTIHADQQGVLWLGTNKGVSRVYLNEKNASTIFNLTKNHGLVSEEINDINSIDNTIFIATTKGIMKLDATRLKKSTYPPPIYFTQFRVNTKDYLLQNHQAFSHTQNFVSIGYESLNYRNKTDMVYQYRIHATDTHWVTTRSRKIQFPRLSPGDYTVSVRAKNEDGLWGNPSSFTFIIKPPFYKTWWFILTVICIVIAIIYWSFKVNVLAYNKHIQQEILKRVLKRLGKQSYILIEVNKQRVRINENKILFVEAFKNYVEINTIDKKYLYRSTMSNMEEKLSSIAFVRTHRSFIVQKDKIDSISDDHLMVQKHKIPIGKTYRKKLKVLKKQFFDLNG